MESVPGPQPPKVSVIIPCFNLGAYLDEAVASVLAQTDQDFESSRREACRAIVSYLSQRFDSRYGQRPTKARFHPNRSRFSDKAAREIYR